MKELNFERMEKVNGGMSAYCETLLVILENNNLSYGAMQGWVYGASAGSCWSMDDFVDRWAEWAGL